MAPWSRCRDATGTTVPVCDLIIIHVATRPSTAGGRRSMPSAARLPGTAESIATSGQELRSGRISSVELTRTALDRIEAYSTALNAVVTVTAELALEAARRADRDLRAGCCRGPVLRGCRHRHRRLDPDPGRAVRGGRAQADYGAGRPYRSVPAVLDP